VTACYLNMIEALLNIIMVFLFICFNS